MYPWRTSNFQVASSVWHAAVFCVVGTAAPGSRTEVNRQIGATVCCLHNHGGRTCQTPPPRLPLPYELMLQTSCNELPGANYLCMVTLRKRDLWCKTCVYVCVFFFRLALHIIDTGYFYFFAENGHCPSVRLIEAIHYPQHQHSSCKRTKLRVRSDFFFLFCCCYCCCRRGCANACNSPVYYPLRSLVSGTRYLKSRRVG